METLRVIVGREQVRDLQREAAAWRRAHASRRWAARGRHHRKEWPWS
jgi:hypothetical protein